MRWILKLLSRSYLLSSEILFSSLLINILGLASTLFVIQVYGRYLVHGIDGTLITLASGMLAVIGFELILRRLRYRMGLQLIARRDEEDSRLALDNLLDAKPEALMQLKQVERDALLHRNDQLQQLLNPSLFIAWVEAPFVLLYVAAIFLISGLVGSLVALILVTLVSVFALLAVRIRAYTKDQAPAQKEQASLYESVARFELIRTSGLSAYIKTQWDLLSQTTRWWRYKIGMTQDLQQNLTQSFTLFMTVVVISFGAREVIAGHIDFGMLIGMNILAARSIALLSRPAQSISTLLRAQELEESLQQSASLPKETDRGSRPSQWQAALQLKNLAYGYPGGAGPVFEGLTVDLPAGSFVRIIGSNGSGKTTVARLLAGLIEPRKGAVLVDGMDLRQFNTSWWREQLIYVPQTPEFLSASVRQNLCGARTDLSDDLLQEALQKVGLTTLIDRHPEGLDWVLRDGAKNLPPGYKRRLALARALLTDGALVVLDEPFEGLDQSGVAMMTKQIGSMLQAGRTVVIMTSDSVPIQQRGIVIDLDNKPAPKILKPATTRGGLV